MGEQVIRAENLGKKYLLRHKNDRRAQQQGSLRDTMASGLKALARRFRRDEPGRSATREEFWALKGVEFAVQRGEVLGIIGRNGAGKSTLLKILSRITEPSEGKVTLGGRVASLLEVGTGFHGELTGRENIYLNGAILGMSHAEIRQKFDEIVEFAEVERFLDTPVKHYSSGMYMRLAFAVAAHLEPEILIIDEVLAVGDAAFQKKCLGKMGQVAQAGRTVLFVSHNLNAVQGMCHRVVWLDRGQKVMDGPATEVIDDYLQSASLSASSGLALDKMDRDQGYGEQLRLTRLTFNDGGPVCHGEPLVIRLGYAARSNLEDVAFGLGFSNLDGVRVLSVDSDVTENRWRLRRGENGEVEAVLERLHLEPDRYMIDVAARTGTSMCLDLLRGCGQIDVVPGPGTPNMLTLRSATRGGWRQPAGWHAVHSNGTAKTSVMALP
jgi:lipopolysaccharide transport system ATP-binding protein